MGFGRASEMCLSGRLYAAPKRTRRVSPIASCPHDEVVEQALALGREIGANPAPQLRMTKELLTRMAPRRISARSSARRRVCCASAGKTPSTRSGTRFLEKRPPKFS